MNQSQLSLPRNEEEILKQKTIIDFAKNHFLVKRNSLTGSAWEAAKNEIETVVRNLSGENQFNIASIYFFMQDNGWEVKEKDVNLEKAKQLFSQYLNGHPNRSTSKPTAKTPRTIRTTTTKEDERGQRLIDIYAQDYFSVKHSTASREEIESIVASLSSEEKFNLASICFFMQDNEQKVKEKDVNLEEAKQLFSRQINLLSGKHIGRATTYPPHAMPESTCPEVHALLTILSDNDVTVKQDSSSHWDMKNLNRYFHFPVYRFSPYFSIEVKRSINPFIMSVAGYNSLHRQHIIAYMPPEVHIETDYGTGEVEEVIELLNERSMSRAPLLTTAKSIIGPTGLTKEFLEKFARYNREQRLGY